jgi:multiple sugar transport system ATP-binding protein
MAAAPGASTLAFRPEAVDIRAPAAGVLAGSIEAVENLGSDIFLHVAARPVHRQGTMPLIVRVAPSGRRFTVGDTVGIDPDPARVLQFDANGRRLKARERVAA